MRKARAMAMAVQLQLTHSTCSACAVIKLLVAVQTILAMNRFVDKMLFTHFPHTILTSISEL